MEETVLKYFSVSSWEELTADELYRFLQKKESEGYGGIPPKDLRILREAYTFLSGGKTLEFQITRDDLIEKKRMVQEEIEELQLKVEKIQEMIDLFEEK
jgi:hypothetical protein